jgi:glycerol-3-phosphate dehydrogenase
MTRDTAALARTRHDLLVIGGGIHGLFTAYDAAQRGLSVALVERADFGSGLSFNHQRTLHGGLRALGSGQVGKVRRQIAERRAWAFMAPHLVRPLPFLVGTYRWSRRSRLALRVAFKAYDVIGRHRNSGVPPELHLPRARLESVATARGLFPEIDRTRLTGGAVWYDYQTRAPDRLTWAVAKAAIDAGALLANYVEATTPLVSNGRVTGCRVTDHLTNETHEVMASVTVLAAGSGLGPLLDSFGADGAPPLLRAMNMLVDRRAKDIALVAATPSGRMLTAVPWHGRLLVGTHQSAQTVPALEPSPPDEAVEQLLQEANAAFPGLSVTRHDVRLLQHGLTPATTVRGRVDLLPEPRVIRHARRGRAGLLSLVGVKYTTARWAAARAVDAACEELGRPRGRCRTASTALPHAGVADVSGRLTETLRALDIVLDRDVADHLGAWYGTEAPAVVEHAAARQLLSRIDPSSPVLEGEVSYALAHARAVRLADVVLRRTSLGSDGHPGRAILERAAVIAGESNGWTDARRLEEIAAVDATFRSEPTVATGR